MTVKQAAALFFERRIVLGLGIDLAAGLKSDPPADKIAKIRQL